MSELFENLLSDVKVNPRLCNELLAIAGGADLPGFSIKRDSDQKVSNWLDILSIMQIKNIYQTAHGHPSVAFFCPTKGFRNQFAEIPKLLEDRGITVLYLYGEKHNDEFEKYENSFCVGGDVILKNLGFIDVFCVASTMDCLPHKSKKILFNHISFADFTPNKKQGYCPSSDNIPEIYENYGYLTAFFPLFDYYFVPSKVYSKQFQEEKNFFQQCSTVNAAKPDWLRNFFLERLSAEAVNLSPEIVEIGYPKFDYVKSREHERACDKEKIIVYAPTHTAHGHIEDWRPYISVIEHGFDIVSSLAENFPEFKIVFKPHIEEDKRLVDRVMSAANTHQNIYLSSVGSKYADVYNSASIMVSDFSSTAYTFAISTKRPVLFFSHNEKVLQNKLANNEYCINRERVGVVTSNLSHLVRDTSKLLGDQDHYERIICSFVDENIFNFGESSNRCVDKICSIVGV